LKELENKTPQNEACIKLGDSFRESCLATGDAFRESCLGLGKFEESKIRPERNG